MCPSDLDHPFIVALEREVPDANDEGRRPWWGEWGVAAFTVRAVAEALAAIMNGETPPAAKKSRRFVLEHEAGLPRGAFLTEAAYQENKRAPSWIIRANVPSRGRDWSVARFRLEAPAQALAAALTEDHYEAVLAAIEAERAWIHEENSRELAEDPLAQELLDALRRFQQKHPRRRLWGLDIKESADRASSALYSEKKPKRKAARRT